MEHLWWKVNICSRNGLVPSGNKPLLTQIYMPQDIITTNWTDSLHVHRDGNDSAEDAFKNKFFNRNICISIVLSLSKFEIDE